jgi:hypothetical protein
MLAAIEPEARNREFDAPSFGSLARVIKPLWDGRQNESSKPAVRDKTLRTDYQEDRSYASVHLSATVGVDGSDLSVDQDVLAVRTKDGWYVSTWHNAYWRDLKKRAAESESQARDPVAAAFAAQLDSDSALPGQYVPPHPGADGQLCSERSCAASMDDRRHVSDAVLIPICSKDQTTRNKISDPYCYTSNPPTSGNHGPAPAPFAILRQPANKEALVHNMEHGGVVVWYNTTDQRLIKQLEDVVSRELRQQRLVVISAYAEMEPETIALTSWTRLDKFSTRDFTEQRVEKFIERHNKRFNPEGF